MTKEQLNHTRPIDIRAALRLAFDAGCSYGIASHKDFVQIHEPCDRVVDALAPRVTLPNDQAQLRSEAVCCPALMRRALWLSIEAIRRDARVRYEPFRSDMLQLADWLTEFAHRSNENMSGAR